MAYKSNCKGKKSKKLSTSRHNLKVNSKKGKKPLMSTGYEEKFEGLRK